MKLSYFNLEAIHLMEQRHRATFINSLGGFKSVCLIGTKSKGNQTNLAIFNSIVHIGANPPLVGFVIRPDSVERHTLNNILETGTYTINHINKKIYKQAHQTSARYSQEISEFTATGLTEEYKDDFLAPYVLQSNVKIGLELKEKIDFKINGTVFIIGEIKHIYLPEICLEQDGHVNLENAGTITCSGLDSYHFTTKLARLSYAKPNVDVKEI
ncbi:MAG: flavin reductase [Bacteroidota bacterium]|nr:flavin reductase [Bacteroidota bacterium]